MNTTSKPSAAAKPEPPLLPAKAAVVRLTLDSLTHDPAFTPRSGTVKSHVHDLARALRNCGDLDPIKAWVDPKTGKLIILDGRHRVAAYRFNRANDIPAVIFKGDRKDARLEAAKDNAKTTFPWTTSECTQYAWGLVIEGEASKRQIVQAATISIGTVTNMRKRFPLGVSAEDTSTVRALLNPDASAPEPTLRDAMKEYIKERIGDKEGRRGRNSVGAVERAFGYAFAALGKRGDLPLSQLRNADGIKVRDFMLAREKQGGGMVSPASVRRELNPLAKALNLTIKNFDLEQTAKNIFQALDIPGLADVADAEKRDSLPPAILNAITQRLLTQKERQRGALSTLRLMWQMLVGTGCRVSEIAGLRLDDLELQGAIPHIRVRWNEDRRVKTRTSIRSVPLCGDALTAARKAVDVAGNGPALFSRYGGPSGGNNASAALMKHVNAVTPNPKHVAHSLRHNMADWLRLSGSSIRAEKLILGHSLGGVGDRVYGGRPADLKATYEAMLAAHAFAKAELHSVEDPNAAKVPR